MLPKSSPIVLLLASLFTSCVVGTHYTRPDVSLPDRYRSLVEVDQRPGTASSDLISWWEGFGDPQLTRFVVLALEQNLDLAQASARVAQARAGLRAASASLRPIGTVSGQASGAYQSLETPLGQVLNATPNFDRYGEVYEANFGGSWELDLFGGLRHEREAAFAEYQASEAGAVATRLAVVAQSADIYISIRGLQTRLVFARRQVQTQQELRSLILLLHGRELATEIQVWQAESALAQARAILPELEAGLDAATNALDVILGKPPGTYRTELADFQPIPDAPQIAGMGAPGDLLRRRPDLIVAERHLAASNARIGVAVAEFFPKLSLSGLIGSATAVSGANLFTSGANQVGGLLGLRWRLFDFGRINAQINQSEGREAELLAAYRLAVLRASEDVENALSALVNRGDQVAALELGEDSLSRVRTATKAAYQKGAVSMIEVLQAEESLLRASEARTQAQTEHARATVAVFKALGGGWNPPLGNNGGS